MIEPVKAIGNGRARVLWDKLDHVFEAPDRGSAGYLENIEQYLNLPGALPEWLQGQLTADKKIQIDAFVDKMAKLICHQVQYDNLVMPSQYYSSRSITLDGTRIPGNYDQRRGEHEDRVRGVGEQYAILGTQLGPKTEGRASSRNSPLNALQYFLLTSTGQHHDDPHPKLSHNGEAVIEALASARFHHDPFGLFLFSSPEILGSVPEVAETFRAYPLLHKCFLATLAGSFLVEKPEQVKELTDFLRRLNQETREQGLDRAIVPDSIMLDLDEPMDQTLIFALYPFHVLAQDIFDPLEYEGADHEHTELDEDRKLKALEAALVAFLVVRINENGSLALSDLDPIDKILRISGHKYQSRACDPIAATYNEFIFQACLRADPPIDVVDFLLPFRRRDVLESLLPEDRLTLERGVDRDYKPTLQVLPVDTSQSGLAGLERRVKQDEIKALRKIVKEAVDQLQTSDARFSPDRCEVLLGITPGRNHQFHFKLEGKAIEQAKQRIEEHEGKRKSVRNKRDNDFFFSTLEFFGEEDQPPRMAWASVVGLQSLVLSVKMKDYRFEEAQVLKEKLREIVDSILDNDESLRHRLICRDPVKDRFNS